MLDGLKESDELIDFSAANRGIGMGGGMGGFGAGNPLGLPNGAAVQVVKPGEEDFAPNQGGFQ